MSEDLRLPQYFRCANTECEHEFIGLYNPLPPDDMARLIRSICCPMCACQTVKPFDLVQYRVSIDDRPCDTCGRGGYWTIVSGHGHHETAVSQSWDDHELVSDICKLMNIAFLAGSEKR